MKRFPDRALTIGFAVMTLSVLVLLGVTVFTVNPWLVLLVFVWFGFIWANWREFSNWRRGDHAAQQEARRSAEKFQVQAFLMASIAADRLCNRYKHLGALEFPEVRDHLRELFEHVARHPLPADVDEDMLDLRKKAADMARTLAGQPELH